VCTLSAPFLTVLVRRFAVAEAAAQVPITFETLQGYLAHYEQRPPRTLQYDYARALRRS